MSEPIYEFECPECGFDNKEAKKLATEQQKYCGMCAGDSGRDVLMRRWLPGQRPTSKEETK